MRIVFIGITLFALFFGAGNLIFPVMLGQLSGTSYFIAALGFVITGVLMPLLGVIALGFSGEKDFLKITQRGGKIFGLIFATTLYLTIGPLFAMPRTGSVSYEIAIKPLIDPELNTRYLAIFSFCYFGICCLLSINPNKIVDIVGKVLTPLMLLFILILIIFAISMPMGQLTPPVTVEYQQNPFFTGFTNGYLTMDTLASLIFGIIVVYSVMSHGIRNKTQIIFSCIKASLIAATILAIVYISLAFIGAHSVEKLGILNNGGQVLAQVSGYYFNLWGNLILGVIVTMACMTTSIGLTTSCANYAHSLYSKLSYRTYAIMFSIISGLFANIGLTQLISISVPILTVIYPATITLIILIFCHRLFKGKKLVYMGAIYCTLLVSLFDGLNAAGLNISALNQFLDKFLPLYSVGIGWLIPAFVGGMLGYLIDKLIISE